MKELTEEERLIRQYLLRELDDEGQRRLEERVFTDHAYLERVLMTEDELVEDFVFDDLPAPDKERFVAHFLSAPQQVRKLEITEALKEYAARASAPAQPTTRVLDFWHKHKRLVKMTLAASLLLAVLGGAWLLTPDPLIRELARLNSGQSLSPTQNNADDYSLTLTPVRIRGDAAGPTAEPATAIPLGARVVRLRLALMSDKHDAYRVTLQQDAAAPLTVDKLKPELTADGKVIPVRIPARLLTPGYYQLTLSGYADGKLDDNLDSYTFRVRANS